MWEVNDGWDGQGREDKKYWLRRIIAVPDGPQRHGGDPKKWCAFQKEFGIWKGNLVLGDAFVR